MKCRIGLLGLPNVGKSSLFNALAQQSLAAHANFPFCTIDPNVAPIAVPDSYLEPLAALAKSTTARPATMEWIDVAGLAPNAHKGEGLGNQFLGTLRECHALCHVVRVFENAAASQEVVHVVGRVNPLEDVELINLELVLADLEHVQRRIAKTNCQGTERRVLEQIQSLLQTGKPARSLTWTPEELFLIKSMGLLTLKPVLFALNVDEIDFTLGRAEAEERIQNEILPSILPDKDQSNDMYAIVSAKLEADLYERFSDLQERYDYFASELGMQDTPDLEKVFSYTVLPNKIKEMLNLSLVYTGPGVPPERSQTTKAHLFSSLTAHDLAANLHGDIQKGFIRAQVVPAPVLLQFDSLAAAKEAGCVRTEGRNYPIAPNDVVLIQWK